MPPKEIPARATLLISISFFSPVTNASGNNNDDTPLRWAASNMATGKNKAEMIEFLKTHGGVEKNIIFK